ncbi:MAG: hypothetical protein JO166_05560 [Deltaproteobacteria bacterium]|nr:hypothetical protein [Deltaproteobacteria bacterium]
MKAIKASYRVEIRREREAMTRLMSAIREWLDARRFEPDTLRCATDEESVTFLIGFGTADEAAACAETFRGRVAPATEGSPPSPQNRG